MAISVSSVIRRHWINVTKRTTRNSTNKPRQRTVLPMDITDIMMTLNARESTDSDTLHSTRQHVNSFKNRTLDYCTTIISTIHHPPNTFLPSTSPSPLSRTNRV